MTNKIPENHREQAKLNITIRRYIDFPKMVSLIEMGALWFSRLGALEDQFEGTLPQKTRLTMIEDSRKWFSTFPNPDHQKQLLDSTDRNVADGRCVLVVNCWSLGENESLYMWKEYARNEFGIAIRSTIGRLRRSLYGDPNHLWIGVVEYIDFKTNDMTIYHGSQAMKRAFLKRDRKFEDECELRVCAMNDITMSRFNPDGSAASEIQKKGPGGFDPFRPGLYIKVDLDKLIESIYVAPGSPGWFLELLKRITKRYGLNAPILFSELD
ncbi:MAG: hypothetical protein WCD80_05270 [Desulfobaccales bacterium]